MNKLIKKINLIIWLLVTLLIVVVVWAFSSTHGHCVSFGNFDLVCADPIQPKIGYLEWGDWDHLFNSTWGFAGALAFICLVIYCVLHILDLLRSEK